MTRIHPHCRRGFSIVEATLAMLLIGTTLVAAMNVSAAAHRTSANANQRQQAYRLAQVLMAEVMSQPAVGTDGSNATGGARLGNFDHIEDYDGFNESPPRDALHNPLASASWRWGVTLGSRAPETIDARSLDAGMRTVLVFVELPDGSRVRLRALRSGSSRLERQHKVVSQEIVQVPIEIVLGDGSVLYAAPSVRAKRPPAGSDPTVGVR
jgi:type II secretory pathway pseudopilin PulG